MSTKGFFFVFFLSLDKVAKAYSKIVYARTFICKSKTAEFEVIFLSACFAAPLRADIVGTYYLRVRVFTIFSEKFRPK